MCVPPAARCDRGGTSTRCAVRASQPLAPAAAGGARARRPMCATSDASRSRRDEPSARRDRLPLLPLPEGARRGLDLRCQQQPISRSSIPDAAPALEGVNPAPAPAPSVAALTQAPAPSAPGSISGSRFAKAFGNGGRSQRRRGQPACLSSRDT
jgi:hypothetical protein